MFLNRKSLHMQFNKKVLKNKLIAGKRCLYKMTMYSFIILKCKIFSFRYNVLTIIVIFVGLQERYNSLYLLNYNIILIDS